MKILYDKCIVRSQKKIQRKNQEMIPKGSEKDTKEG